MQEETGQAAHEFAFLRPAQGLDLLGDMGDVGFGQPAAAQKRRLLIRPQIEIGVVGAVFIRLFPSWASYPNPVVEPMPKQSTGGVELSFDAEATRFRSLAREDTIAEIR